MIEDKMLEALNKQVNAELYSSYLYLSMSAHFTSKNLLGFANWMRIQAQEEMVHVMKIYDYILERGGRVTLHAVEAPPAEWPSALETFQAAYEHEQKVTAMFGELLTLANSLHDHATSIFLQWFVTEQVEEEASSSEIVEKLRLVGDARGGMFMLDRELGARTFVAPTSTD